MITQEINAEIVHESKIKTVAGFITDFLEGFY